jgi:hypothetical protein
MPTTPSALRHLFRCKCEAFLFRMESTEALRRRAGPVGPVPHRCELNPQECSHAVLIARRRALAAAGSFDAETPWAPVRMRPGRGRAAAEWLVLMVVVVAVYVFVPVA